MKRILAFGLILIILLNSGLSFAYADMESKLVGHWPKGMIERGLVSYYFPYLAKNNFEKLNPDKNISKEDFFLSLRSLSKDYNLDTITDGLNHDRPIKRVELINYVGKVLNKDENLNKNSKALPFKDINNIGKESIELIKLLYNLNIINGVSVDSFAPNKMATQAEAIIVLQRMKGALENMKEISFEVKGAVQSYNSQENVVIKEKDDSVLVTITKQFSTPGYSLGVDKIIREGKNYKVILDIKSPAKDAILPQVITYKTITIEVNKSELNTQASCNFVIEGIKSNLS